MLANVKLWYMNKLHEYEITQKLKLKFGSKNLSFSSTTTISQICRLLFISMIKGSFQIERILFEVFLPELLSRSIFISNHIHIYQNQQWQIYLIIELYPPPVYTWVHAHNLNHPIQIHSHLRWPVEHGVSKPHLRFQNQHNKVFHLHKLYRLFSCDHLDNRIHNFHLYSGIL